MLLLLSFDIMTITGKLKSDFLNVIIVDGMRNHDAISISFICCSFV